MILRANVVLFVLLSAAVASAQPSAADRRRAGDLFHEGERLYERESWSLALAKFQESYDTVQHDATRFNVGKCLEKLGRLDEADHAYTEVSGSDDEALAQSAREARARLTSETARIRVTSGTDQEVTIAGEPCPALCERLVRPGEYDVVVGTGADARTEHVTVAAGETRNIEGGAPTPAVGMIDDTEPRPEPVDTTASSGFALDRLFLWGGVAIAAVGLTMTVIFGLRADALENDVADARLSGPDPSDVEDGQSAATLANVGLVVALVGVGCAAAGLYLSLDDEESDPSDTNARLGLWPGGLVLSGNLP